MYLRSFAQIDGNMANRMDEITEHPRNAGNEPSQKPANDDVAFRMSLFLREYEELEDVSFVAKQGQIHGYCWPVSGGKSDCQSDFPVLGYTALLSAGVDVRDMAEDQCTMSACSRIFSCSQMKHFG